MTQEAEDPSGTDGQVHEEAAPSSVDTRAEVRAATPLLVVDAANVVGSVPDGWWRDRAGANRRLRDALVAVSKDGLPGHSVPELRRGPIEIVLVVEGAARRVGPITDVQVVAATRSGDDAIVRVVDEREPGRWCAVATADRELSDRVRARGAVVIGPRSLPRA